MPVPAPIGAATERAAGSASPEEMLDGVALDAGEAVSLGAGLLELVVLEGAAIGEQLGVVLSRLQGRQIQVGDAGLGQCLLHPRIGPEGVRALTQGDVEF